LHFDVPLGRRSNEHVKRAALPVGGPAKGIAAAYPFHLQTKESLENNSSLIADCDKYIYPACLQSLYKFCVSGLRDTLFHLGSCYY
jgi:hypothetical protein